MRVCVCVCQVIVHEVPGQELEVEVFDKDHDHDDFLGRYHITAFFVSHLFFKRGHILLFVTFLFSLKFTCNISQGLLQLKTFPFQKFQKNELVLRYDMTSFV